MNANRRGSRTVSIEAKPEPITIDLALTVTAPDGRESRILIRDTWNTDILDELKPEAGDTVLYKTRYSGFYGTDLDAILKRRGIKALVVTGATTCVCVDSTIRDTMFRDYMHPAGRLHRGARWQPVGEKQSRSRPSDDPDVVRLGLNVSRFHQGAAASVTSRGRARSVSA